MATCCCGTNSDMEARECGFCSPLCHVVGWSWVVQSFGTSVCYYVKQRFKCETRQYRQIDDCFCKWNEGAKWNAWFILRVLDGSLDWVPVALVDIWYLIWVGFMHSLKLSSLLDRKPWIFQESREAPFF